jgi:AcrR family transcriptional regulator
MLSKLAGEERRVDPRVRRTRQLIETAFVELLAEQNFQSITVQDITDRALVNRATFYAHFEDKYDLLKHYIRDSFQRMISSKLASSPGVIPARLQLLVQTTCEYLAQLHGSCSPTNQELMPLFETEITGQLAAILHDWLAQRACPGAEEQAPELAVTMMSWAIYGAARQWSRGDRRQTPAQFAAELLPLMNAIRAV